MLGIWAADVLRSAHAQAAAAPLSALRYFTPESFTAARSFAEISAASSTRCVS